MLLSHIKRDVENSRKEAEAPLGWVQDTLPGRAWGDADLSTPPPGRAKEAVLVPSSQGVRCCCQSDQATGAPCAPGAFDNSRQRKETESLK